MSKVIGIGGKLRAGKDEIANHLVAEHGWVKMGMSDALADALYELNPYITPLAPEEVGDSGEGEIPFDIGIRYQNIFNNIGYVEAKEIPEVRRLLQVLGTEVGRKMIDENVWVNILDRRIKEAVAEGKNVILTGVRYPNELAMIHANGGATWWVDRPDEKTSGAVAAHSSENTLSAGDFDLIIVNSGTLDQLKAQIDYVVSGLE